MPIFFVGPIWLLVTITGLVLLLFRGWRYLSSYLILGSTLGFIASVVLSTAILFGMALVGRAFEPRGSSSMGVVALGVYMISIPIGALLGIVLGMIVARRLNRSLGWHKISN